ncbi:MAG TPA: M56 family metallopeptidase [Rhodanobacteraceae bacterium]|nr:M56 family metallopeptidase [Rhodanobacteraceae bacterium]
MLVAVTLGLVLVLLLRRPARRVFGAGPAFTLWLLPIALMLAPLLPQELMPTAMVVLPGLTVTPQVATAVASTTPMIDWTHGLMVLWLFGVSIGLLRLALHYFRLLRGMRAAPPAWAHMLAEAESKLGTRRVRVHDAGPAVLWMLPRALILLPADFMERFDNAATRGLVLRHELTHVRRGDALWSLAMEIATVLLWFHPLAWIARARFRLDQELACDAASLRASPERNAGYARALLDSVAVQPAPALIPWLAEPQLKERIAMLSSIPPGALRRRVGFLVIAMLLTGGLVLTCGITAVRAATTKASTTIVADRFRLVGGKLAAISMSPSVDIAYKNRNPPAYPINAIRNNEQGTVVLRVRVDASGQVTKVDVDRKKTTATSSELQAAAVVAAESWRFNPGEKDGKPVGGAIEIPVMFSLHELKPCRTGEAHASTPGNCKMLQPISTSS